jgi:hypothetical protein
MVLCGPRTGSNMLTSALHSHPEIVCFREVFNFTLPAIDYNVAGFDGRDPAALALRKDEPAVLMERCLFSGHGPSIRAVGFKFIYEQFWDVPGLIEALQAMPGLRVIHRRRTSMPCSRARSGWKSRTKICWPTGSANSDARRKFVDVAPRALIEGVVRQNPGPIRNLIANFDELSAGVAPHTARVDAGRAVTRVLARDGRQPCR